MIRVVSNTALRGRGSHWNSGHLGGVVIRFALTTREASSWPNMSMARTTGAVLFKSLT